MKWDDITQTREQALRKELEALYLQLQDLERQKAEVPAKARAYANRVVLLGLDHTNTQKQ